MMLNKKNKNYENKTLCEKVEDAGMSTMDYSRAFELYRNNNDRVNLWCSFFLKAVENIDRNVFLDCGCGVGRFTIPMSKYFCETYGVDIDRSMLEIASKKNKKIKWINSDVRQIPLPNNTTNAVLSSMLIEHLDSLDIYFSELQRIIKLGGVFLLRTMLPEDIENTTWYIFSKKAKHLELNRTRSYDEICHNLSECGFNIIENYCRLNVTEKSSSSIVSRLKSKSYEIIHQLSNIEYNELLSSAIEWEKHKTEEDLLSSSLLVFRKE